MGQASSFAEFENKMRNAGMGDAPIRAFRHGFENLASGKTGLLPESSIQPVTDLPRFEEIPKRKNGGTLLSEVVVVKLNGGLGTGMGLEKAKSLLPIKDGLAFLDFIARQILWLREKHHSQLRFLVMNSFSTGKDTLDFFKKYPGLGEPAQLQFMQSAVPKVDAKTRQPAVWPKNPELEWCPPGHGDLYPSLLGSGWLDRLMAEGVKYLFVSNSDNLGACLDLDLLGYFAGSGKPFLMEVCERAAADRKGGHIAQNNGRFLLRETAQVPDADQPTYQDINHHRFFNTNNLWMRLDRLKTLLTASGGFLPLSVIQNSKTVDPRDKTSPKVIQLESAMGAAIECFPDSGAIIVPRARFAPVKTTSDLLALRSDAYHVTEDWRLVLSPECNGVPPMIELDPEHYKLMDQFDAKLAGGVPSLVRCRELKVTGPVAFSDKNVFAGNVTITNKGQNVKPLPAGEYKDRIVDLS
jgi:UDP-N-acetylglucosamine pyrophosphorylase